MITPPSSPRNDALDDIYGSAPSSPTLAGITQPDTPPSIDNDALEHPDYHPADEILSDLPSRRRILDTDAYREGLSNSKGQFVQEGFDEGYSLGANLGERVGFVLGVLQGLEIALRGKGQDKTMHAEAKSLVDAAESQLEIGSLLGEKWVNEEGIWKWEVHGTEEDVTFKEVAEQHPVVQEWTEKVLQVAEKWNVDLKALAEDEDHHGEQTAL